jgi:hypothetical protein
MSPTERGCISPPVSAVPTYSPVAALPFFPLVVPPNISVPSPLCTTTTSTIWSCSRADHRRRGKAGGIGDRRNRRAFRGRNGPPRPSSSARLRVARSQMESESKTRLFGRKRGSKQKKEQARAHHGRHPITYPNGWLSGAGGSPSRAVLLSSSSARERATAPRGRSERLRNDGSSWRGGGAVFGVAGGTYSRPRGQFRLRPPFGPRANRARAAADSERGRNLLAA